MAQTSTEILSGINYPELKSQKAKLLSMIEDWESSPEEPKRNAAKEVVGIVNLIDSIQDHAVDVMGKDESEVFDLTEEE